MNQAGEMNGFGYLFKGSEQFIEGYFVDGVAQG